MSSKKSQTAMEHLATYGWVLLIVLIVGLAFAYFGIINPNMFFKEKCQGTIEIPCVEERAYLAQNRIELYLVNGLPDEIKVSEVKVSVAGLNTGCTVDCGANNCGLGTDNWISKMKKPLIITECTLKKGDYPTIDVRIKYMSIYGKYPKQADIAAKLKAR